MLITATMMTVETSFTLAPRAHTDAVNEVPTIKRVVLTSSVASVVHTPFTKPPGYEFSDADWNTESSLTDQPYSYSKTLVRAVFLSWTERAVKGSSRAVEVRGDVHSTPACPYCLPCRRSARPGRLLGSRSAGTWCVLPGRMTDARTLCCLGISPSAGSHPACCAGDNQPRRRVGPAGHRQERHVGQRDAAGAAPQQ